MAQNIDSLLVENRVFTPSEAFSAQARVKNLDEYQALYRESLDNPDAFWGREAGELTWQKKWDTLLDWSNPPFAKWFVGGKVNASENCVDRHVAAGRGDKVAILWEGENDDKRSITYKELQAEVSHFANALSAKGLVKGDRVLVYMPMTAEAAVAMLACARLGLVHSVVFGGFSSEAIKDRLADSGARAIITADGGYRRGSVVPLKANVDRALETGGEAVEFVIVQKRTGQEVAMKEGRDIWWSDAIAGQSNVCPPPGHDAEDPLFILYTSGSTGKPKGILHTTGGYLVGTYVTSKYIFDLKENDVYWCTADVGWITGHSYIVYGPLAAGATLVMYEGAPNWPKEDRFWKIVQDYKVTILYTAPTAIRAFIKWGDEHPNRYDLTSLRLLGTVGEPINPEAWMWYYNVIGGGRCPIVDTWWQTETGAIMISPLPGATPTTPGTATLPFFGIDAAIVDDAGNEVGANEGGKLVIRRPWPSMLRTLYGDPERFKSVYWSDFPGKNFYFTGDGARRDEHGNFWIVGRIDDVLNVSGHRLGTSEIESALVAHPAVAEAAAVGRPDEMKGQAVVVFVTLKGGFEPTKELETELRNWVGKQIGAIAKPDNVKFADALPKTRSGKIMRRLLKEIAAGKTVAGDTTTLEDVNVIAKLSAASSSED